MKPLFNVLKANHMGYQVLVPQVYAAIGHPELADQPAWGNTCAIRMSVALIAADIRIWTSPVALRIKGGKYDGAQIEPKQKVLSNFLVREVGQPEKFKGGLNAHNGIAWRRGIVSFLQLHGSNQGHIDLVSVNDWPGIMCSSSCYWDSLEVWFWPLR